MRWFVLVIVLLSAFLAGGVYYVRNVPDALPWLGEVASNKRSGTEEANAATSQAASDRYILAPVEQGRIQQTIVATGTLQAVATVEVGSQLSGQIERLFANFNDTVTKDQPLAQLDQGRFEARRAEAAAAVEMAEAAIETGRAKVDRAKVDLEDAKAKRKVLEARADNARVKLAAAERTLERKLRLAERGTITESELEEARAQRDSAGAALREAEAITAGHEHAVAGARVDVVRARAELANARASLPQKQAQLRAAEIDLERSTVRSPITGIVIGRDVSEGQTVAASLEAPTLFTIAGDLKRMEIHARVDEADIGKVTVGQRASFSVDAYPDRRFEAVVHEIRKAPQVLQNVVTYTVVLGTTNPERLLLPGMTALIRIVTAKTGSVLTVPLAALRFSPESGQAGRAATEEAVPQGRPALVWTPGSDESPRPVTVGVGPDDGSEVAVLSGSLREGDMVIVSEHVEESDRRIFGIRIGF